MARKKRRSATTAGSLHMLIVEARFYDAISDELLRGATRVLDKAGARYDRVTVPGALEIPAAIAIAIDVAKRRRAPYDGVVALGCVIRGETHHFDIVANESARALIDLALGLVQEQLLARAAVGRERVAAAGVDHEVADVDVGRDAVEALESALEAGQGVHYWITLPGSTSTPSARSFFSIHASRVRSHCS